MAIYRKHPAVYIGPVFWMILWLATLLSYFAFDVPGALARWSAPLAEQRLWLYVVPIVLAALLIGRNYYRILLLKSVTIAVSPTGVEYRRGVLPWKKIVWVWQARQIFRANYAHGFMGWLFKSATVQITGTEGVTSHFSESAIGGARKCVEEINALAQVGGRSASGGGEAEAANGSVAASGG